MTKIIGVMGFFGLALWVGWNRYEERNVQLRTSEERQSVEKYAKDEKARHMVAEEERTSLAPVPGPRLRPAPWAQRVVGTDLGNFFKVSEGIYRSEQPDSGDMKMLEKMGVKSILNLRDNHDDDDEAEGTILALYRVEMRAGKILDEDVARILKVFKDAPKPLLVHCWHGSDRTGLACALWRMHEEGWKVEAAVDELVHGDFGHHEDIYPNIPEYLRALDLKKVKPAFVTADATRGK